MTQKFIKVFENKVNIDNFCYYYAECNFKNGFLF